MSALPLPPNPCLLAILLITKHQNDPSIIFHYPPRPGQDDSSLHKYLDDNTGDESSSSDDDSTSSADDQVEDQSPEVKPVEGPAHELDVDETGSASPEKRNGMRIPQKQWSWDEIFGHNAHFLAQFLCPARSGHKKRFEVSVNDKVFLGRPAFANEGGGWRKKRRRTVVGEEENLGDASEENDLISRQDFPKTSVQVAQDLSETSGIGTETEDQEIGTSKHSSTIKRTGKEPYNEAKQRTKLMKIHKPDSLSMFQVVFIMAPPPLEYHLRVDEMYDHVVKKFSRALKWEQARSGFVSREANHIDHLIKSFGRGKLSGPNPPLAPLYHELLKGSSLAKAIANIYSSISTCRIAHVNLTPTLSLSLQIPIPTSTSVLPSLISHQLPGLWLTTATSIPIEDDAHVSNAQLASHFTLLILSDLPSILAEIQSTDSPLAEPLARYIQVSKPTESFLQISQSSGIALSDIQFLASHLIYWRRARAIPPLHKRDIYIVSPNADMDKLASATSTFAKLFPTLPSLPKILSLLSSTPRPYSTLIPSKDHKEAYMDILAWLFRYGWVTQLRTFAWIRVPPHILQSIARHDYRGKESEKSGGPDRSNDNHLDVPNLSSSPISSTHSSTNTALPLGPPSPPTSPILVPRPLHPTKPTSAQLSAMSAYILANQGEDTQAAWDKCVRYFDGKHALETIAIREGWKRKRVGDLISGWENIGFLKRVRHW